jgi:hypothetical protein
MIRRIFTEEEVFDLELKAHGQVQYDLGRSAERERIIKWVKENRREFEIEEGVFFYRDSFQSEDLIAFIKGERE